jgi:probable phosphoglycerate mutase
VLNVLSSYPELKGRTERHLTSRGERQAKEAGEKLKDEGIDVIIASPLTRTLETAQVISDIIGVPVFQDIRLRETDFGAYNTESANFFFQKYTKPEERIVTDGSDGVESTTGLRGRVESLLSDITREFAGQKVVLVSHADTLEQIHGKVTGESIYESAVGWSPDTGMVTCIQWGV